MRILHALNFDEIQSCLTHVGTEGEARLSHTGSPIAEEAVMLRREVVWLGRVTIRRAEEARRELGPLCEAAARESKISIGVNRAIERIASRDWAWLDLESSMPILDEHDGTLFSDLAIENYLDEVMHAIPAELPTVPHDPPDRLPSPITAADLIERLQGSGPVDDLMAWILEAESELPISSSLRLFDEISRTCGEARPTEEQQQYARDQLSLSAVRWVWNSGAGTSEVSS